MGVFLFYRWIHANRAETHEWSTSEFAEASIIYLLMVLYDRPSSLWCLVTNGLSFHVLWFIAVSPVIDRWQADRREARINGSNNGPRTVSVGKSVKAGDLESSFLKGS